MKRNAVVILIISIASISVWDFLFKMNLLSVTASRLLWALSICFFVYAFISQLTDFEIESKYFKAIIYIFLFYQFVTMVRGFSLSANDLKTIFREPQNFWPFVIPLFVFFDKRFFNIVSLIKTIYVLGLLFLLFNVCFPFLLVNRLYAQYIISAFALGSGFILMNATYLDNKKVTVAFLVILIAAFSYTYFARRSTAFTFYAFIISSYLLNAMSKSRKLVFKLFPLIIGIALIFYFYPNKYSSVVTKKMNERLFEDTRTELFQMFFLEMNDFKVFGKGMNGTYYYPMEEIIMDDGIINEEQIYRNNIENGYLQLYLTGGVINMCLFVLVLLPAAINGIFRSSNHFTRSCGVMIFLWLLDMFLYGLPLLSLHYIIIWICVGICYKSTLRKKTDVEIMQEFQRYNLN